MTVDGDTLSEGTVTVRHRDSMEQERVPAAELRGYLGEAVESWKRPERKSGAPA